MLVGFHRAIDRTEWSGEDVEAVAMGRRMIIQMEAQYRAQVELARVRQKDQSAAARAAIQEQGGHVNGEELLPGRTDAIPA